jgi:hypothetical protein
MITEWMKVMLEEISRKKAEAEQIRTEEQRRRDEHNSNKTHKNESA